MADTAGQRYWAFLSYSHADEAAAVKLHRALENYTLPRRLRKAHGLPARLVPIFRDVDELEAASGLNTRLQDALDESRWMIVLCSPAAAASKYVNTEIEYFLRKHGPERILCVLGSGDPPACFPPAIRSLAEEPLAADLRPGRDAELGRLKLLAALAGVGFTELRNREAQRRARQRIAAMTVAGLAVIGAFAYWDLLLRVHVDYYIGYVRRDGIWQGVDPISENFAAHRGASYRMTRRGRINPPSRADYINGSGTCAGDGMANVLGEVRGFDVLKPADRFCSVTFSYAHDGAIQQETLLSMLGVPKQSLTYTAPDLAQFTQQGFDQPSAGSGARYVQFTRDVSGRDRAVRFLFSRGVPRPNQKHEYGYAYEYDVAGRLLRAAVLDDQGKETGEVTRYTWSPEGFLAEERNEDAQGHARPGPHGYAATRHVYDEWGNALHSGYYSADGEPALGEAGYAVSVAAYDDHGNQLSLCYFDEAGAPASGDSGSPCEQRRFDPHGRVQRVDLVGADGKPVEVQSDGATLEFAYDARGNLEQVSYFDSQHHPVEGRFGSGQRDTLDERGNLLTQTFFGADGKPVMTPWGAQIRHRFDERDNAIELSFLDTQERPWVRPDNGFALQKMTRDERSNITAIQYFDAALKPVIQRDGYAAFEQTWDDQGNPVEKRHYDTRHALVRDSDGIAIYRSRYDRVGRRIEETYFDEQQRPVAHRGGWYGYRALYDSRGRQTQLLYLDARGAVANVPGLGRAGVRFVYDRLGRMIEELFLGPDANPLATGAAVVRIKHKLDEDGAELERQYLNAKGALAVYPRSGCAMETHEYDKYGDVTAERCLNPDLRPANRREGGWAVHAIARENGNVVREEFLDAAGRSVTPRK